MDNTRIFRIVYKNITANYFGEKLLKEFWKNYKFLMIG